MNEKLTPHLRRAAWHVLPLLALVGLGLFANQDRYWLFLATSAVIAYILTAGFNIIFGYAGIFALSHVALYGIAAYASVYFEIQRGLPFWPAALLAVVLTGTLGALLALPTSRLESVFMATATLGFAVAVVEVFGNWTAVTGGQAGIVAIPVPTIFGHPLLSGTLDYFWLCAAGGYLAFQISWRIHRSGAGRKLKALRESPRSLWAVGASPTTMRIVAFTLSSILCGIAGVLYAHFQLTITPETFSFHRLIGLLLAAIIGGAGTLFGPVLGVGVLVWVDEFGSDFAGSFNLIYGVAVVILLAVGRNGVSGFVSAAARRVRDIVARRAPREPAAVSTRLLADVLEPVTGGGALERGTSSCSSEG